MNDSLLFDSGTGLFRYNHGRNGWAYNWPPNPGPYYQDKGPEPAITGINQLYADGSVRWKKPADFPYRTGMATAGAYEGGWVGLPSGPRYY